VRIRPKRIRLEVLPVYQALAHLPSQVVLKCIHRHHRVEALLIVAPRVTACDKEDGCGVAAQGELSISYLVGAL